MLCLLCAAIRYWAVSSKEVYFTENVADYNSKQYPLASEVFMPEIPTSANVISFAYYKYWGEAKDIYLELEFSTKEEMETYLSNLKKHGLQSSQTSNGWFVTEPNPYDPSFTDLFCTVFTITEGEQTYTGYSVDPTKESNTITYKCNFAVISYSYEKLIVIQSRVSGFYRHNIHNYTPQYFLRFDVPLDKKHARIITVE